MKMKKYTKKEIVTLWVICMFAVLFFLFSIVRINGSMAKQLKPGSKDNIAEELSRSVAKGYVDYDTALGSINGSVVKGGCTAGYITGTLIPGHYLTAATIDTLIANGTISAEYDGHGYDELGIKPSLGGQGGGSSSSSTPSKSEEPKKHEHNYTKELTTVPTCTTDGEYTYTCSCGDSYTQQIIAPGHDWEDEERVEPVCEIAGYIKYTCKLCGESMREDIPALEHNYILTETIEPACTEDGYLVYTCENCGEEKREVLEKTNHPNTEWVNAKESGFFTAGREELTCKDCGEVLETKTVPAKQDWRIWAGGLLLLIVIGTCVTLIVKKAHKKK